MSDIERLTKMKRDLEGKKLPSRTSGREDTTISPFRQPVLVLHQASERRSPA